MDMMAIRRRVLMGGKKVIDTSPIIEKYGYKLGNANTEIEDDNSCIVQVYAYPKTDQILTMVSGYLGDRIQVYRDGKYIDWWGWNMGDGYKRQCINKLSDGVRTCIPISNIANAYAYLKETGQILFAGKNSPYYGYTNINDMPT